MLIQIEKVLDANTLQQVAILLNEAEWQPGDRSAGASAKRHKKNLEMDQGCESWVKINEAVVSRLYKHAEFQNSVLPSRVSAAFVSCCKPGMFYGPHVDDPVMGSSSAPYRSDVAVTVFLSEPDSYDGGELQIQTRFGPIEVKLPAGSAVAYPASSLHEVKPVNRGERVVCALWVQSLVRDPAQREILADLDDARRALKQATPDASVTTSIDRSYMNLVRMWAEV